MHKVHLQQFVANRKRSSMKQNQDVPLPSKEEVEMILQAHPRWAHKKRTWRPWDNPEFTKWENERFEKKLQTLITDRLPISTETPPENPGWIHSFSEPDMLPTGETDAFEHLMRMRRKMGFIPKNAFPLPDGSDDGEGHETRG